MNGLRRKLSWFSHVCRHDTLPKIILQGTVDSSRRRRTGRQRKLWRDNIKELTGLSLASLLHIPDDMSRWVTIAADASAGVPQRRRQLVS